MSLPLWLVGLLAFCAAAGLTGVVRRYAVRVSLMDVPSARSSHAIAKPRGGGLAIVMVCQVAALILVLSGHLDLRIGLALLVGGSMVAFIGWLDDRKGLSAISRLAVHFVACSLAVWVIEVPTALLVAAEPAAPGWLGGALLVVALVWFLNLFNFMDGIDGIASAEALCISASGTVLLGLRGGESGLMTISLVLAAAAFGFLLWNWAPARIFLGDAGSGYLGYTIGTIALASSQAAAVPLLAWVILAGLFIVDATLTLMRRAARGDRVTEPHNTHAYQRLAARWRSHAAVTSTVILTNLVWFMPLAYGAFTAPHLSPFLALAALAPAGLIVWSVGAGLPQR